MILVKKKISACAGASIQNYPSASWLVVKLSLSSEIAKPPNESHQSSKNATCFQAKFKNSKISKIPEITIQETHEVIIGKLPSGTRAGKASREGRISEKQHNFRVSDWSIIGATSSRTGGFYKHWGSVSLRLKCCSCRVFWGISSRHYSDLLSLKTSPEHNNIGEAIMT